MSSSEQPSSRTGATSRQGVLDAAAFDVLFRECATDVHGYLTTATMHQSPVASPARPFAFCKCVLQFRTDLLTGSLARAVQDVTELGERTATDQDVQPA